MADTEREQVEWVFGLTGGELNSEPLTWHAPGDAEGSAPFTRHYWFDGVPEYAGGRNGDFPHQHDRTYLTLIEFGCGNSGIHPVDQFTDTDGDLWVRVDLYASSGECECPERHNGADPRVEALVTGRECPLCGETQGEEHGYIYIGDVAEVVYERWPTDEEIAEEIEEH